MNAGPSLNEEFAALLRRPSDTAALDRLLTHDVEDLAVLLDQDLGRHLPHAPEQSWAVHVLDALVERVEGTGGGEPEPLEDDPQIRETRFRFEGDDVLVLEYAGEEFRYQRDPSRDYQPAQRAAPASLLGRIAGWFGRRR